ncbi:MAG: hypothetical protein JNK15_04870 [Planctomycetes bacterium]|nr:hypothetical protein [Planctomycetota bacterium]
MASSPAEATTPSARAFALQELIACWNQGYEALLRGDLDGARSLLDIADDHVAAAGDGRSDTAAEAALRIAAASARGRLEHAMKAGLDGLQQELARARHGGKALRGYGHSVVGPEVVRDA